MTELTKEEKWKEALTSISPEAKRRRKMFCRLPSPPRCKLCAAPFKGPGSVVARAMGHKPWGHNPTFCEGCLAKVSSLGTGGAEVEISMLFADVRGSTSLAEEMTASEFAELLDLFYSTAVDILVPENAMIDKFVGDEVVALFIPAFAGTQHAIHAIRAGINLLAATGHGGLSDPWIPVGIGVHTGIAYVGNVGGEGVTDVTALGDAVNTTARLASAAAAGEILVTREAARAASLTSRGLDVRSLDLKGKSELIEIYALSATDLGRLRTTHLLESSTDG